MLIELLATFGAIALYTAIVFVLWLLGQLAVEAWRGRRW